MAGLLLLSLALAIAVFDTPLLASAHTDRKLQNVGTIVNYGGKLLTSSPLDVYLIYYGSWPANSGQTTIQTFIRSLSSNSGKQGVKGDATVKSWWETLSLYNQKNGGNVSKNLRLAGAVKDNYSMGKGPFGRPDAGAIILNHVGTGKPFPFNPKAMYFILASPDVQVKDICNGLCGYHAINAYKGTNFGFGYVVRPGASCSGCIVQYWQSSPNGNPYADSVVAYLGLIMAEVATNPFYDGWMDRSMIGGVQGVCINDGWGPFSNAWPGHTATNVNGKKYTYNVVGLSNRRYFLSPLYNLALKKCTLQRYR